MDERMNADANWTDTEKWVWEKTCLGEVANLNIRCSVEPDPRKELEWDDKRIISCAFLETILLKEPYRTALPRQGLRIAGAWFKEKIDLSNARLVSVLWLDKCRFEEAVNFFYIRTDDFISLEKSFFGKELDLHSMESKQTVKLDGSMIAGKLIMYSISVGKFLFMRNGMECAEIDMQHAKIGEQLDMTRARFISKQKPGIPAQNNSLPEGSEASFTEFDFSNAEIGGSLIMNGIEITGKLDLSGLSVHRDMFIREHAALNEIDMTGAEIGGQLGISGAKITDLLELNGASVHADVFIRNCDFCKALNMVGVKIGGQLDIVMTKVEGILDMDSINVATDLFIKKASEFGEINIMGGTIGGKLDLNNIVIDGDFNMRGLSVALDLAMYKINIGERHKKDNKVVIDSVTNRAKRVPEVDMRSGKVGGQLDMADLKMKDKLNMDGLSVAQQLYFRLNAEFLDIQMVGPTIGGHLILSAINVKEKLEIQSAAISQSIFVKDCEFGDRVSIIDSSISGSIVTSNNKFMHLDLGGTSAQSELQMGESRKKNLWTGGSAINLRNTNVKTLSDGGEDSWPEKIDFDGFVYTGLGRGARGDVTGKDIDTRDVKWLAGWLAREKPYSSQPYYQLAQLLDKMGYSEKANSILYAYRERERDSAWDKGLRSKWLGLSLLNWTIGYGYGARYFRALIWVFALLFLGMWVIGTVKTGTMQSASLLDKFGFSLDKLIPVIELNDKYKLDFSGWQLFYFYMHRIMGVILSSFVVAGLSGITKEKI